MGRPQRTVHPELLAFEQTVREAVARALAAPRKDLGTISEAWKRIDELLDRRRTKLAMDLARELTNAQRGTFILSKKSIAGHVSRKIRSIIRAWDDQQYEDETPSDWDLGIRDYD